jgi:beta-galactosidase
LTAGANYIYNSKNDYAAVITSYDYESPITENGNVTEKYLRFRELIQGYLPDELPPIP